MNTHKFAAFGFKCMPFTKDISEPFIDENRKEILRRIKEFLKYRGFAVLCGAPGNGKTMLLQHTVKQLSSNESRIIYIPFSVLTPSDMLKNICIKLDLEPTISTTVMLERIQNRISEIQPVHPVLALDEIQKISHETLEIIRLMTNFNFEDRNHFSVFMAGTEEFLQKLKLRINEPLRQRITCFCKLPSLSREATGEYIKHHFTLAGCERKTVDEQSVNLIYDLTSGNPRMINSLMLVAIENAADAGAASVSLENIRLASEIVFPPKEEIFQ